MNWALYALLHSLCRAFFVETNRVYKVDSWHLTFMQALLGLLVMLPLVPFMNWPEDVRFYFAAIIVSLITAVGYMIQLGLAQQKTGRVSGMYMPLEAVAATVIWILVMPAALELHSDNLLLSLGVVIAFALSTFGMIRIRESDVSWATFLIVAPVGITYAVSGIATKIVMPETMIIPTVLSYVLINYVVMTLTLGGALLAKKKATADMLSKHSLKAGLLTGAFSVVGTLSFVASVALAPNPGYTSMMAMLLPFWLLLFHKALRIEDNAQKIPAMMLALGVVILIAVTTWFGS
ncbi:MAG: hypothetical protein ACK4NR_03405 [Micavibrio sp.]